MTWVELQSRLEFTCIFTETELSEIMCTMGNTGLSSFLTVCDLLDIELGDEEVDDILFEYNRNL